MLKFITLAFTLYAALFSTTAYSSLFLLCDKKFYAPYGRNTLVTEFLWSDFAERYPIGNHNSYAQDGMGNEAEEIQSLFLPDIPNNLNTHFVVWFAPSTYTIRGFARSYRFREWPPEWHPDSPQTCGPSSWILP